VFFANNIYSVLLGDSANNGKSLGAKHNWMKAALRTSIQWKKPSLQGVYSRLVG